MRYLYSLFALFLLTLAGCSEPNETAKGPVVLAAASMQEALDAAADAWADKGHPRPVLSFAASSALARQISSGAQADLYISADTRWMDVVAQKGLIVPETRAVLVTNSLVLVAPRSSAPDLAIRPGFDLAAALGGGRLAMANPDGVPAGRYGKQALESLGVWDSVKTKIASGENVRVALGLVSRNEAPLGIVYATDAIADPRVKVAGTFPDASHAPIIYPIALLKTSRRTEARAFLAFLLSPDGQAIFAKYGFGGAR